MIGFVGAVARIKQNITRTREYFDVNFKVGPTEIIRILISNHKEIKFMRQKFMDAFHDKMPVMIKKLIKSKDVFFFNAYSGICDIREQTAFTLNEADAVQLSDINDEGLVDSIVCHVRFTSDVIDKSYYKDGKNRTDRMREGLVSDGTRTLKVTFWGDLAELVREDCLIQFTGVTSRTFNEELEITSNYSTRLCFLSECLDINFDERLLETANRSHPSEFVVCCPKIECIKMVTQHTCKNCSKKLKIMPGTGMCKCLTCGREYQISSLEEDGYVSKFIGLDLKSPAGTVYVTMAEDVVKKYFTESDEMRLKNKILSLERHDFVVTTGKKFVKELKEHVY